MISKAWFLLVPTLILVALSTSAQSTSPGRFSNFETPQTHPIDLATVGEDEYVLVCNTPDNSVEIYEATSPFDFVARVPVGLGPASVRWSPVFKRFFVCNFDGDSVSVVRLVGEGASASNPVLECTTYVGDEPSDIAFNPNYFESTQEEEVLGPYVIGGGAYVTLSSQSRYANLTLSGSTAGFTISLYDQPVLEASFSASSPDPDMLAVKMPRQIECLANGDIYVSNLRGGSPANSSEYDVGIYKIKASNGSKSVCGGLGSTNHAFAISSDGSLMFVVGTSAQNHVGGGLSAVAAIETGFVRSYLYVVDLSSSGMTVRAEAASGTTPRSINLNRDYTQTGVVALASSNALVQPTAVLLIESGGSVSKVVLTAYHSDRVAILTPSGSASGGYTIQRINLTPLSGYSVCGPRGLVRSASTGLIYVNGRLDNSLRVIDPSTATQVYSTALANDPTPGVIRTGREFLYSSRFSGGFVSCASCHVDGRTDGLYWNLSEDADGPAIPDEFHDGEGVNQQTEFESPKGRMVTQSLQGLINYPLNEDFQFASTNAPYYWRGVRRGPNNNSAPFEELNTAFDDFNEAFVKLQGMTSESGAASGMGLTAAHMRDYRLFVNTILYPPNPEQMAVEPEHLWLKRETQGALPTSDSALNTSTPVESSTFTGAKLGMTLFHNFPTFPISDPTRSCVDCHNLPEGSSNTATLLFPGVTLGGADNTTLQTLETAALRGIATREMWLHADGDFGASSPTHLVANVSLFHAGEPFLDLTPGPSSDPGAQSINAYNENVFKDNMPSGSNKQKMIEAVTEFVRKFDTGVANAAGFAYTVDPTLSPLDSGLNAAVFDQLEHEVKEGNIGLGVYTRNSGDAQGYWYDITVDPAGYRAEGSTGSVISRATLLALAAATDDVVIAQGTPLGTERRWASAAGVATQLQTPTLSLGDEFLFLLPMVPNTAYVDVGRLNGNLNLSFLTSTDPDETETTIWALRKLQESYYQSVLGEEYDEGDLHHEPPRRFRVTGYGIRPGAKLFLEMSDHSNNFSEDGPEIEMDLYPVRTNEGDLVWETYQELDGLQTFALLNGGYLDDDVLDVLLRTSTSMTLDPNWRIYKIRFENEDAYGNFNPNWQTLNVQIDRSYSP